MALNDHVQITMSNRFYLGAAIPANNHPFKSLVDLVAILRPELKGKTVIYTVEDLELFLEGDATQNISGVDMTMALQINAQEGVLSFVNYPFYIQCDDKTVEVPSYFPSSTYYAEDDLESETPLQKTFEQWVLDQSHDVYPIDGGGSFAGDFARYGLDFATQVASETGFSVWDKATAVAAMPSNE